jgi:hypothetical protein
MYAEQIQEVIKKFKKNTDMVIVVEEGFAKEIYGPPMKIAVIDLDTVTTDDDYFVTIMDSKA